MSDKDRVHPSCSRKAVDDPTLGRPDFLTDDQWRDLILRALHFLRHVKRAAIDG